MRIRNRPLYPTGPNGERLPSRPVIERVEVAGPLKARQALASDLQQLMRPPSPASFDQWLAILAASVPPMKAAEEVDHRARHLAYRHHLLSLPADAVRAAMVDRVWRWWPSVAELLEAIEPVVAERRAMIAALERPDPEPEAPREPVAGEVAQRIVDEAALGLSMQRRLEAHPRAQSRAQLDAAEEQHRVPHWTELANPDGPEMQALAKARAENPLVQAARAQQARSQGGNDERAG